jgi:hypothetical protein
VWRVDEMPFESRASETADLGRNMAANKPTAYENRNYSRDDFSALALGKMCSFLWKRDQRGDVIIQNDRTGELFFIYFFDRWNRWTSDQENKM